MKNTEADGEAAGRSPQQLDPLSQHCPVLLLLPSVWTSAPALYNHPVFCDQVIPKSIERFSFYMACFIHVCYDFQQRIKKENYSRVEWTNNYCSSTTKIKARYKPDKELFLRSILKAVLKRFVASQKSDKASFPRSTHSLQQETPVGPGWDPRARDPGTAQAAADTERYIRLSQHSRQRAPRRRHPSPSAPAQAPAEGTTAPPGSRTSHSAQPLPGSASPWPLTAPRPHCRSPPALLALRLTAVHLEALMPGSQPIDLALLICQKTLQLSLHRLGQLGELGPLQDLLQHGRHLGRSAGRHRSRRAQGAGATLPTARPTGRAPRNHGKRSFPRGGPSADRYLRFR